MKVYDLKNFIKGWFIGNFEPTLFDTKDFEIAVKHYSKGDKEASHYHKIAEEYTVVVSGKFRQGEVVLEKSNIAVVSPNESVDFECLEDGTTVVVKVPSIKGDKHLA